MKDLYQKFSTTCSAFLTPLVNLSARIYIGMVFFRSGLLKLDDWENTLDFFADDWALPFLPPVPAAYLGTAGELLLPALLFIGLFTRFAATGLFFMTLVIELFVLPGTQVHHYWMLILALLVSYGGDKLSLDYLWLKTTQK